MQFAVTFRHLEATNALKEYAQDKVHKIRKYFPEPIMAHVVFDLEGGFYQVADVTIKLPNGITIKGREATEDMYSSMDLVMAKIERQVRRYKDRIRSHKARTGELEVAHHVLEEPRPSLDAAGAPTAPEVPSGPRIIKTEKFHAHPLTVDEAVMQLNLLHDDFLVFRNADSEQVNVVYRRSDGNYGLIEPSPSGDGQARKAS